MDAGIERFFSGDLSEILFYPGQLPEAERRSVETYLMAKYLPRDDAGILRTNVTGIRPFFSTCKLPLPAQSLEAAPAKTRCEISFGMNNCPLHPEIFGVMPNDIYGGADLDRAKCFVRARDQYGWCGATQPITATYYEGGQQWAQSYSAPAIVPVIPPVLPPVSKRDSPLRAESLDHVCYRA